MNMITSPQQPLDHPHSAKKRIPVRLRLKTSTARDIDGKESVSQALKIENKQLKESINSISTAMSENCLEGEAHNQVKYLILKYRSQLSIKNLKIKTLERKLNLVMAHLQPSQIHHHSDDPNKGTSNMSENTKAEKYQTKEFNTLGQQSRLKANNELKDESKVEVNSEQKQSHHSIGKEDSSQGQQQEYPDEEGDEEYYAALISEEAAVLEQKIAILEQQITNLRTQIQEYANIMEELEQSHQNKLLECEQELSQQAKLIDDKQQIIQGLRQDISTHAELIQKIKLYLFENCPFSFQKDGSPRRPNPQRGDTQYQQLGQEDQEEESQQRYVPHDINILQTMEAIMEDYEEQAREVVEMEEYIQQLKIQYEEKANMDDKVFTEEEEKIRESERIINNLKKEINKLQEKCRYLQDEVAGYQSKFSAMEASQRKEKSSQSESFEKMRNQNDKIQEQGLKLGKMESERQNQEGNTSDQNIEKILFGDQELEDESISYSDRDLRQMKAIYDAAQATLQENSKLKIQNQRINQQLQKKQNQLAKIKIFIEKTKTQISQTITNPNSQEPPKQIQKLSQENSNKKSLIPNEYQGEKDIVEELQIIMEQKIIQTQIQASQREEQLLYMLSHQLDDIFQETIFKGERMLTLNDRITRIKQTFEMRPNIVYQNELEEVEALLKENQQLLEQQMEMEREKVRQFQEGRKQMDLTQSKLYLSQLQVIIRKLQRKNQEQKKSYEQQGDENRQIQAGLMNYIRDLAHSNRAHKRIIEETSHKLTEVEDIDELQTIIEFLNQHLYDTQQQPAQWNSQQPSFYEINRNGNLQSEKKMLIRSNLVQSMKKKYFTRPSEFVELLIDRVLKLTASSTEDQLMDGFENIFLALKERDEVNSQEKLRREVLVKQKVEYINQLCKKGREPGFGQDLSESRIGMVRSWQSKGIRESGMRTSIIESGTRMSKVFENAMKSSKRFQ